MLKSIVTSVLIILGLCASVYAGEASKKPTLDRAILELPITLTSGETVTLQQYKGSKPLYLKFWASYCRDCLQQMPHLQKLYQKYGDRIQIVAVNLGVNEDAESIESIQKRFDLQMPIAVDKSGKLAKAFNLIATPYHVLLDGGSNIVYAEYAAPKNLDKTIKLVAERHPLNVAQSAPTSTGSAINLSSLEEKPTALFFVATWCDWYLKRSHPSVSRRCIDSQNQVNRLAAQYPQINWVGVVTRLWTEDKDVAEYRKRFKVKHSLMIDSTNSTFLAYDVKDFPTLVLLDRGKEVFRTRHIDAIKVSSQLQQVSPQQ
jgi:thiol-disulfide isomerase/thioredoxin